MVIENSVHEKHYGQNSISPELIHIEMTGPGVVKIVDRFIYAASLSSSSGLSVFITGFNQTTFGRSQSRI